MTSIGRNAPSTWIAAIPLLLLPCGWVWFAATAWNDSVQTGMSAQLLLIAGSAVAWMRRDRLVWPAAMPALAAALAWQGISQFWTPVPEVGMQAMAMRFAAAAAAMGCAAWVVAAEDRPRLAWACGLAGLGLLVSTALTLGGRARVLGIGDAAPFGNVNFTAHTAVPLIAVAVAYGLATAPARAWLLLLVAMMVAVPVGMGWMTGDPCRALWLGMAVAAAAILVLRLPARAHAPLLIAGTVLLIAGWLASFLGALDPAALDWGVAHRIYMWRASIEALSGTQALTGLGTGSCLAVLPDQPSFQGFWLTLPGWTSHPHNELLSLLLDGGAILAALMSWGLWLTLRPLWQRRSDPLCAALLVGWSVVLVGCMVDTHLREPGGLLMLAVLAGLSWAQGPSRPPPQRLPGVVAALPMCLLAGCAVRELAGYGGTPSNIQWRALAHISREAGPDPLHRQQILERLRLSLGPLTELDYEISLAIGQQGRLAESLPPLLAHVRRMPCHAGGLHLAARLRHAGVAPADLLAAEAESRRVAGAWLERVPENERNREVRRALEAELQAGAGSPP